MIAADGVKRGERAYKKRSPVLKLRASFTVLSWRQFKPNWQHRKFPWMTAPFPFHNTYARLPERFFTRLAPTPVRVPRLIRLNRSLALRLGLDPDWLASQEDIEILAGNRVPPEAEPISTAYSGHQFGGFVPQLGDGRAILLGEVID